MYVVLFIETAQSSFPLPHFSQHRVLLGWLLQVAVPMLLIVWAQ
jgi:hypothetical protein